MPLNEWTVVHTSNAVVNDFFGLRRLGQSINPDSPTGTLIELDTPYPPGLITPDPLEGTGSLQIRVLGSAHLGHLYRANVGQRGWTTGSITSMWYGAFSYVSSPGGATGGMGFGYYCFANQNDLLTSGAAYIIGCTDSQFSGAGYTYDIFLNKVISNGLLGWQSPSALLARVQGNVWIPQLTFTLRVNWVQTPTKITFTVFKGVRTDFSDLTQQFQYEDTSPLSATVGEGLWGGSRDAANLKVFADTTEFYKGLRP